MAKRAYIGVETPQASTGSLPVGSTVFLNVGGVKTEFLVVHQGNPDTTMYDGSCDGTWLLMKDLYEKRAFDSSDNDYANSDLHAYLNGDFMNLFDVGVKSVIKEVKIPYRKGTGKGGSNASGASGLTTKIFLLGAYEVGWTTSTSSSFAVDGARLDYFIGASNTTRKANYNGTATGWWLRCPYTDDTKNVWGVTDTGGNSIATYEYESRGVRPVMILPSNLGVGNDGSVTGEEPAMKGIAHKIEKGYVGIEQKTIPINSLEVGSSVFLSVNGTAKEFLVIQQGNPDTSVYDESCNGTWLLMKDIYENRAWDAGNNDYGNSDIHAYLNGDFLGLFDANIQSAIKEVKIPYQNGTGSGGSLANGSNGLTAKIFLLSMYEVGLTGASWDPGIGVCLSYFEGTSTANYDSKRVAYLNGTASAWWLRSPNTNGLGDVRRIDSNGNYANSTYSSTIGVRPALILDSSLWVSEGGIVTSKQTASIGIARKIRKAYIGIGNVARPCWSGGELVWYGEITSINGSAYGMQYGSVGNYALFGYGQYIAYTSCGLHVYDKSLTYSKPYSTGTKRNVGTASIGDYALFVGGDGPSSAYYSTVDAYDSKLTKNNNATTNGKVYNQQGASTGKHAIFLGGRTSDGAIDATVTAYDSSLTRTMLTSQSSRVKEKTAAVSFNDHAIFVGGIWWDSNDNLKDDTKSAMVYNQSLTKSSITFSINHRSSNLHTSTPNYAIFGGATTEALNKDLTVSTVTSGVTNGYGQVLENCPQSTSIGEYALMIGTYYVSTYDIYRVYPNVYDGTLTKITVSESLPDRAYFTVGSVGDYALFVGGAYKGDTDAYYQNAYAYTLA